MRSLSRRERQIMDVIYAKGKASALEVHAALPDAPSLSAIRATIRILEEKGHLKHEESGLKYVFSPAVPADRAKKTALRHMVKTFFEGSAEGAMAALLDESAGKLTADDLARLSERIEAARKDRR